MVEDNDQKSPQKPLVVFYIIALVVLLLVNVILIPLANSQRIKEVDYGTFMDETEGGKIDEVKITENKILFTEIGRAHV